MVIIVPVLEKQSIIFGFLMVADYVFEQKYLKTNGKIFAKRGFYLKSGKRREEKSRKSCFLKSRSSEKKKISFKEIRMKNTPTLVLV